MGLYENVDDLCKKMKTNAHNVEKACGLSNGTISRLRTTMVGADKLKKIADHFGVTMEYLLSGSDSDLFPTSAEERKIIEAFRQADDGTKLAVLKLLDMTQSQLTAKISAS